MSRQLLIVAAAGLLLWGAYHYLRLERTAAFDQGYTTAQALGDAAVQALHREYATAQAAQAARAHQQLQQAVAASHAAEHNYLQQQQHLSNEIHALQEQLSHALIDQPDCHFTAGWVQHYSQALGLPAATQAANSAASANANTPAAPSSTDLLKHAQSYGHWCRTNTQQLIDLQALLREREN